jgi:2-keto-4-pentenoate hydratase/2-oxohepta-3-ene-1,7-dioic acid hydratase in catechol pathway
VDYENELCFVVSKDAKDVSEADAPDYILCYTVGNDVSSRYWQARERSGGMASYAKSFDGFCPIGPSLVRANVVGDPQKLNITTRRNGHVVQSSNTADMIFGVYRLLSFLSQATTLSAGTIVMTGTPPGVAAFREPQVFLKKGEIIECEIERIGCLKNEII